MNKLTFFIFFTELQVADIAITLLALQNPLNHELNPIPLYILIPVKIFFYPWIFVTIIFSDHAMKLYKEEKNRDLGIYLIFLLFIFIIINNLYWWSTSFTWW